MKITVAVRLQIILGPDPKQLLLLTCTHAHTALQSDATRTDEILHRDVMLIHIERRPG